MRCPINSSFHLKTDYKNSCSYLKDVYFTQPLKMTHAFKWLGDGLKVYQMSSSPGMLEGDAHDIRFHVGAQSKLWVTTQSYEKVFPSDEVGVSRYTEINIEPDAYFKYTPLPTTPYQDSRFTGDTQIRLADETAKLAMCEIITAGRVAKETAEVFAFDRYQSLVDVYCAGKLIYRDNTVLAPDQFDLTGFGFFEGYTHLANIMLINFGLESSALSEFRQIVDGYPDIAAGVTVLSSNDVLVRILGSNGEQLTQIGEALITRAEEMANLA